MGVEIVFKHLHNDMSFSYTSFDNYITYLNSILPEDKQDIINCLSWENIKVVKDYIGPHGTFKAECGTINDLINTLKYIMDRIPNDHGFYRDTQTFLKRTIEESKHVSPEVWIN